MKLETYFKTINWPNMPGIRRVRLGTT